MSIQNDTYYGGENLEVMQEANNYNEFLSRLIMRYKPVGARNIVDFGAGIGTFAARIRDLGCTPLCVEIDLNQRKILVDQCFRAFGNIADIKADFGQVDYVYSLNVLEHIDDDVGVLDQISRSLISGGVLLIYVPAFNSLYSSMDRFVGHVRRYKRSELIEKIEKTGLIVVKSSYVDSLGFFASLALKYFGADSGRLNRKAVSIYDRYIFPVSEMLDLVLGKIFGKNVYVIARKA